MNYHRCTELSRAKLLHFALAEHELPAPMQERLSAHARSCGRCCRLVQRLRSSRAALRTLGETLQDLRGILCPAQLETEPGSESHALTEQRQTLLRGRILGAARDRAWGQLARRLQALLTASRAGGSSRRPGTGPASCIDTWELNRAEAGALALRLRGLGVEIQLADIPAQRPSTQALPWVTRHLEDLVSIVGGPAELHEDSEDYQPSAAPSFLDSLAPL